MFTGMSNIQVRNFWPFPYPPRENQLVAFDWLDQHLAKGTKYLILEAPVGSGKSNIGVTYSSAVSEGRGDSFILTPQKILQEQYEVSFRDVQKVNLVSLYGKGNYKCKSKNTNCEIGSIVKPKCTACPAVLAKQAAREAGNVVMNYRLALLLFGHTTTFKRDRKLMVLDECHTLEQHLVEFDAVMASERQSIKFGAPWKLSTDMASAIDWMKTAYLPKAQAYKNKLQPDIDYLIEKDGHSITTSEMKKLKDFEALCDHIDEVIELTIKPLDVLDKDYVLVHDKISMTFKRLKGAYSFKRILAPMANQFLFMSSTILNKDGFCYDLGIDPNEAAFLTLDSEFPVENRPVVYMPQMKMNVNWNKPDKETKAQRKNMISSISQILEIHSKESGIIHTANFQIAKWLVEELEFNIPHEIHHHNPDSGDKRNDVINAFIANNKPSVLISPSSTEGLDLKEDLGRFAIFVKVPFGNLGDQWIKKRMELSKEWYQRRALIDVIQGGGRIVRGPTDKGNVYILDASFGYLFDQTKDTIPPWWKASYAVIA